MPAEVFDFYLHQAVCLDCDWEGTLTQKAETCATEAEDHNARHHGQDEL